MLNKVMLIGHLGADPETKSTSGGEKMTKFRIATSERWKDRDGAKQERTEWHSVVVFGGSAEAVGRYLRKGSKAYVEGKLQTRKWQTQEGETRYSTEVVVSGSGGRVQFLDGRDDGGDDERRREEPAQRSMADEMDDEIPF